MVRLRQRSHRRLKANPDHIIRMPSQVVGSAAQGLAIRLVVTVSEQMVTMRLIVIATSERGDHRIEIVHAIQMMILVIA